MQKLEPRTSKSIVQLLGVLKEAAGNLVVGRVEAESQIGGEHSRLVEDVRVESIGNDLVVGLCLPLVCASGAVDLLPLILVHVLEVFVAWKSVSDCV